MSGVQSRRLLVNLFLVLLVAGMGVAAWWSVSKPQQGPERLVSLNPEAIELITLERQSAVEAARTVRFEKREGVWMMVAPQTVAANVIRLRQLFTFLNEPVAAVYDSAGRDLAQYGLQPGKAVIRFNDQQFVLGAMNDVSNNRYVLHDNKIKLVSETIFGSVTGDWVNFVALQLIPEGRTVKAVELPEGYQKTGRLVSAWQNADAIRLEPLGEGKQPAGQRVVLTLDDGSRLVFEVVRVEDELILVQRERGIRYVMPDSQAEALFPE